ncbi:MAG: type 4a pilus biogenesis protein PilO [Nitrospirae bacterium]|nr:type 4a pilus biogenesis protein PilO [Nitrospirota bacterium]MCL5977171.1 type 4a pilus biogenesis protein PilO [Nitrospirota bacterium]
MALTIGIDVQNLPPAKKKLLLVMPPLVIIFVFVYFLIMPAIEEKGKLSAEVDKQNKEIQAAHQSAGRLPALIAENEKLKAKLMELQVQLPEEKEVSGLLKQVSELGIKSGLQIILWKPKERVVHPSREIYEINVDVQMRGNYHRFGQFFSNVTKLSRIVNISNINIRTMEQKQQRGAGSILNVSFNATTYSLIPEKERKELEKAEKEKEKEKKKK